MEKADNTGTAKEHGLQQDLQGVRLWDDALDNVAGGAAERSRCPSYEAKNLQLSLNTCSTCKHRILENGREACKKGLVING